MKVEAGRGKVYAALKELRRAWRDTAEVWGDEAAARFAEEVQAPLDKLTAEAIEAMDQLAQIFRRVRDDCEGQSRFL